MKNNRLFTIIIIFHYLLYNIVLFVYIFARFHSKNVFFYLFPIHFNRFYLFFFANLFIAINIIYFKKVFIFCLLTSVIEQI